MTSEANPWRDWIGRTERRSDLVTPAPLAMLSATLDRDDPEPMPGSEVPPLWHWLYFLPVARQSGARPDATPGTNWIDARRYLHRNRGGRRARGHLPGF